MNAQVAAVDNAALQGFLLRRIPPTSEWKLRAEAPGEIHYFKNYNISYNSQVMGK
jgi:hypothetical protein